MPHNNLRADQQNDLACGMHAAAAKYRECAAAIRAERDRYNGPTQQAAWSAHENIAREFDQQAASATELAEIIERATDVAIIP